MKTLFKQVLALGLLLSPLSGLANWEEPDAYDFAQDVEQYEIDTDLEITDQDIDQYDQTYQ